MSANEVVDTGISLPRMADPARGRLRLQGLRGRTRARARGGVVAGVTGCGRLARSDSLPFGRIWAEDAFRRLRTDVEADHFHDFCRLGRGRLDLERPLRRHSRRRRCADAGLLTKIAAMALDVLPDNHPDVDPAPLFLRITALKEAEPASSWERSSALPLRRQTRDN